MKENELIAEFMGLKKCDCESCQQRTDPMWREGSDDKAIMVHYHDSWDWLMPVVEEINNLNQFEIVIKKNHCTAYFTDNADKWFRKQIIMDNENILSVTYNVVVQVIKWYNDRSTTSNQDQKSPEAERMDGE